MNNKVINLRKIKSSGNVEIDIISIIRKRKLRNDKLLK